MDQKAINVIRNLALDMLQNSGQGHPGITMSSAPILYTLFTKHLVINPAILDWINRDRFICCASNASELLYATMFLSGYPLMLDDLKSYRKFNSKLTATPDINTPGIDVSTGFPGEGLASACGFALAEKIYEEKYNYKNKGLFDKTKLSKLFNYYTYVLCDDEDMMSGMSYEAASFAGSSGLNHLIVLWDSSGITKDGAVSKGFNEDVISRFSACGWNTIFVKNGNSVVEIDKAIKKAKTNSMPTLIRIKTIIGEGLKNQGTNLVYSDPVSKEDIDLYKKQINAGSIPFTLLKEPASYIRDSVINRGTTAYDNWKNLLEDYKTILTQDQLKEIMNININTANFDFSTINFNFDYENKELLRDSNQRLINTIVENVPNFIGGSANLSSSTRTYLNNKGDILFNNPLGKNIMFGGRNMILGSVMNGLALSGFRPFASTHMCYASQLIESMKMSALMNVSSTYILTHDSVTVGSDGPVNQPINELAMLRSIPNLYVFRPADYKEVIGTWDIILKNKLPAVISLPKTEIQTEQGTSINDVVKGAYIAGREQAVARAVIIATGAEVQVAKSIQVKLLHEGIDIRVVSMPCMELFNAQPINYKQALLPSNIPIFVIEYGSSFGWEKFVSSSDCLFTVDRFGVSASKEDVLSYLQIDITTIMEKIKSLI